MKLRTQLKIMEFVNCYKTRLQFVSKEFHDVFIYLAHIV